MQVSLDGAQLAAGDPGNLPNVIAFDAQFQTIAGLGGQFADRMSQMLRDLVLLDRRYNNSRSLA